jgi:hypothetical protein
MKSHIGIAAAGIFLTCTPAGAETFDYQVKIIACDTRNCELLETRLPGGSAKARYVQNGIGVEIEPLNSGQDRIDARVLLRVPNGERSRAGDGEGSSELVRVSSLNERFYTQLANYASGENSYLIWARLDKNRRP